MPVGWSKFAIDKYLIQPHLYKVQDHILFSGYLQAVAEQRG